MAEGEDDFISVISLDDEDFNSVISSDDEELHCDFKSVISSSWELESLSLITSLESDYDSSNSDSSYSSSSSSSSSSSYEAPRTLNTVAYNHANMINTRRQDIQCDVYRFSHVEPEINVSHLNLRRRWGGSICLGNCRGSCIRWGILLYNERFLRCEFRHVIPCKFAARKRCTVPGCSGIVIKIKNPSSRITYTHITQCPYAGQCFNRNCMGFCVIIRCKLYHLYANETIEEQNEFPEIILRPTIFEP